MHFRAFVVALLILVAACQNEPAEVVPEEPQEMGRLPAPEGAVAYIISPQDGETVGGDSVKVVFGLAGMGVAPAGVKFENTGHHHLLVDVAEMPDMDLPIPADSHHVHFGVGQTETILTLSPGPHTFQLLLGDYRHIPHDPPVVSAVVSITVE